MKFPIKILIILVFVIAMLFPTLNNYFNFVKNSRIENRSIVEKPNFKIKKIGKWADKFENYYSSNFGGRGLLYKTISHLKLDFFNTSIKPDRVLVGKDKFLFLGDYWSTCVRETLGANLKSEKWLRHLKKTYLSLNKWLKKRNIKYYIVIAANKHSVYPEKLPFYINNPKTQIDQISATNVPFINLKETMLAKKKSVKRKLYYPTESHWTAVGAFFGYEAIMSEINKDFKNLKTIKRKDFSIDSTKVRNYGSAKLIDARYIEYTYKAKFKSKGAVIENKNNNNNKQIFTSKRPLNNMELIICRDSFADELKPYLNRTFKKVTYIRKVDLKLIEKEKPDIFIFEHVERKIDGIPYTLNVVK